MSDALLDIFIDGHPAPGGSKTAFPLRRRDGSYVQKNGRLLINIVDAGGKANKLWRRAVRVEARRAMKRLGAEPFDFGLEVQATFFIERPKGHYGTGRNAGILKADAAELHLQAPDALKLMRSTEDALTEIVYVDDSLIVAGSQAKLWGERPGCRLVVRRFDPSRVTGQAELFSEPTLYAGAQP